MCGLSTSISHKIIASILALSLSFSCITPALASTPLSDDSTSSETASDDKGIVAPDENNDVLDDEGDGEEEVSEDEENSDNDIVVLSDESDAVAVDDESYYTVTIPQSITLKKSVSDDEVGTDSGKGSGTYSETFSISVSDISDSIASVTVTTPYTVTLNGSGYAHSATATVGSITEGTTSPDDADAPDVTSAGHTLVALYGDNPENDTQDYTVTASLTPGDWDGKFDVTVEAEKAQPVAFAVLSTDDNSLRFYKRINVPAVGDMFNGLTVTKVYTGIETDTYSSWSDLPWSGDRTKINTIVAEDIISPVSISYWFRGNYWLLSANLEKLDTSKITDMSYLFSDTSIKSLSCSSWDTSNVTTMDMMFYSCSFLTTVDVSSWDMSSVKSTNRMFALCSKLKTLDVSKWNLSSLEVAEAMFGKCSSLTTLDVSNWDTSSVTNFGDLFKGCSVINNLDVSKWDVSNVTEFWSMFYDCYDLESLDVSNWNTASANEYSGMFHGCSSLKKWLFSDNGLILGKNCSIITI
jgi:surface protein